jgi:DNA-binding protein Fis
VALERQSPDGGLSQVVRPKILAYLKAHTESGTLPSGAYDHVLNEVERTLIEEVLTFSRSNQTKAAKILGIHRNTLRQRIRDLSIG